MIYKLHVLAGLSTKIVTKRLFLFYWLIIVPKQEGHGFRSRSQALSRAGLHVPTIVLIDRSLYLSTEWHGYRGLPAPWHVTGFMILVPVPGANFPSASPVGILVKDEQCG
jgi:hypothetical protein